jgi:hypothetical protein
VGVLRRIFLVAVVAGPLLAIGIIAVAAFWISPAQGAAFAAAAAVASLAAGLVCTAWFAVTNAVLRSAADAVGRQRLAEAMVQQVFELACQAAPGLAQHEVTRRIEATDWGALNDALQRLRQTTCGDGKRIRSRAAGWMFDAVAKRMNRSLSRVVDECVPAGETVRFNSIPSIAAGLVNDSIARGLRSAAWRTAGIWLLCVAAIGSGMVISST